MEIKKTVFRDALYPQYPALFLSKELQEYTSGEWELKPMSSRWEAEPSMNNELSLVTTDSDASFDFPFNGRSVGAWFDMETKASVDIYVDDKLIGVYNGKDVKQGLKTFKGRYSVFASGLDESVQHKLKMTISANQEKKLLSLHGILVDQTSDTGRDNIPAKKVDMSIFKTGADGIMNDGYTLPNETEKVKTVVILGNSHVRVSPQPDLGWYGDWGMAATARDSDLVHLLIRDIHQKDPSVVVKFRNIADFEKGFDTYPLSNLDSLRDADMLIMKISENVNDKKAQEDDFISWYDKLIKYIAPEERSVKIIVDGFRSHDVNRLIEEYALKNNYPFVTVMSLSKDSTNTAKGKFIHKGVANHPSDKGMRMIEQQIWNSIKDHFERP